MEIRSNIRIRDVMAQDRQNIEAIVRRNENFSDEEKACAVELLDIYLKDQVRSDYIFFCAVNDNNLPLGYICYGRTPFTDAVYDMYWIAVDPALHGRRIGAALVRHLEDILVRKRARALIAETSSRPAYEKARIFYERTGFLEAARVTDFYRTGDDKIIYVKRF